MAELKIVFFGADRAGKTSLIQKYVSNEPPNDEYEQTIASLYNAKSVKVFGNQVRLDLWDIAGPERFSIFAPMYYCGSNLVIVVFDINDKDHSYERALIWIEQLLEAKKEGKLDAIICLLATKIDIQNPQVTINMATEFANRNEIPFFTCSALTGQNVNSFFESIADIGLKAKINSDYSNQIVKVEWVPDGACKKCCSCSADFTFSNRRHHCRQCGFIFCNNCSSNKKPLPKQGYLKAVRVCKNCFLS